MVAAASRHSGWGVWLDCPRLDKLDEKMVRWILIACLIAHTGAKEKKVEGNV